MKIWRKPFDQLTETVARGHVDIDKVRCKGCGFCVDFCPKEVLKMGTELNPKGYLLAVAGESVICHACGYCEAVCPEFAIKITVTNSPK
ncbi:ferredoxin family protein [Chloroflexota bacterium]